LHNLFVAFLQRYLKRCLASVFARVYVHPEFQ
jgi:hypothetical protein